MGLHEHAHHGRVFRGLDARKHLEMQKRNSFTTGDNIKLNIPDSMKVADNEPVATLTQVVYETVSADFTGPIAGYTTLSAAETTATIALQSEATTTAAAVTTSSVSLSPDESAYLAAKSSAALTMSSVDLSADESSYLAAKSSAANTGSAASTTTVHVTSIAEIIYPSSTLVLSATSASVTASIASTTSAVDGTNNKSMFLNPGSTAAATAAVGTPLSQSGVVSEKSTGMTSGAKAGLAIGVLLALALAGGLLLFCWRRRKNPNAHQELFDEKHGSTGRSFFGGKKLAEKRVSTASEDSARAATTAPRLSLRPVTQFLPSLLSSDSRKPAAQNLDVPDMSEKPKSMWERRSQNEENPFGDANQISEKQVERPVSPPTNPFEEPEVASPPKDAAVAAAPPPSPTPRGPNNVHRVQLDFKPSMDDELELKSGQLVRMLHEYDDGWALCIRMDRSQQGVVPRTCLSKVPVKPRPQGPSAAQSGSPTPNASAIERPQSPAIVRKPVPGQA
ncbi:hypothetical protein BAUCODRAFT_148593 [Baudoinia panamericana UAMH 10762]|uniref:SH3 domain-containing protein n=1 Tax=Baudoinia panamericana (strain UAMH 10762) TaxID=717646 RepID=M2NA28_BAUPA|nr:uncharacterized protein BAUCODRAFT_148593 [Baudoinia panamericana UAMH 10762]EMC95710.1 hypothetical protein BAUCODRAFT_148593 [Baudoinia panamericana UAMH 10762]